MPVHHCDLVEGTTLGQGGFHGPGSSSQGLFSSSVEGSALPREAVEPVPAEAVSTGWLQHHRAAGLVQKCAGMQSPCSV